MNEGLDSNNQIPPLILASQSPRRKTLMREAGYEFEVLSPSDDVECGICSDRSPEGLVLESAFLKAQFIARKVESRSPSEQAILISADTVAACQGQILGKPRDVDHAEQMLRLLSGTEHAVLTGTCLWHRPSDVHKVFLECTTLKMDPLSDEMLKEVLDSDMWIGKAGAFGFQDGLDWAHIQKGLESNVVGLPVEKLQGWMDELMSEVRS